MYDYKKLNELNEKRRFKSLYSSSYNQILSVTRRPSVIEMAKFHSLERSDLLNLNYSKLEKAYSIAYKKDLDFPTENKFGWWMASTTMNLSLNDMRGIKHEFLSSYGQEQEPLDTAPSPSRKAAIEESEALSLKKVSSLPKEQQEIIRKLIEGNSVKSLYDDHGGPHHTRKKVAQLRLLLKER